VRRVHGIRWGRSRFELVVFPLVFRVAGFVALAVLVVVHFSAQVLRMFASTTTGAS
jgi:hypothetical protein